MMKKISIYVFAAFMAVALAACAPKREEVPRPVGKLAVAGFVNPAHDWELLAGYIPAGAEPVKESVLGELNGVLVETLQQHGVQDFAPPQAVKQCASLVLFEDSGKPRMSALDYWMSVGQCMQADYLLVPQLLQWVERKGSSAGVTQPATVVLDIYLLDVKNRAVRRTHYDETQKALSENLLDANKFFRRGGKWVEALRIAADGINEKLLELGL